MSFSKKITKHDVTFIIEDECLDDVLIKKILLENTYSKRIGLDMSNVQNINSPLLIKCLTENKIKLFNLNSEVLTYFALILKDGFLKSYINYSDFSENKREFVKRHFLVA